MSRNLARTCSAIAAIAASSAARVSAVAKSPPMTVTPATGAISSRSTAITQPVGPTFAAATCAQPPGAAPRSTTTWPRASSRSLASISSSLNAARER